MTAWTRLRMSPGSGEYVQVVRPNMDVAGKPRALRADLAVRQPSFFGLGGTVSRQRGRGGQDTACVAQASQTVPPESSSLTHYWPFRDRASPTMPKASRASAVGSGTAKTAHSSRSTDVGAFSVAASDTPATTRTASTVGVRRWRATRTTLARRSARSAAPAVRPAAARTPGDPGLRPRAPEGAASRIGLENAGRKRARRQSRQRVPRAARGGPGLPLGVPSRAPTSSSGRCSMRLSACPIGGVDYSDENLARARQIPRTISVSFWPPKPKLFDRQARTVALRAWLGT